MASSPILFTLVHLGVGGAQKIGSLVMNALVEQGYDVAVCCYWREVEHVQLSDKVRRYFLFESQGDFEASGVARVGRKLKAVSAFRRVLHEVSPDCVVSFGPDPLVYPAMKLEHFDGKLVCCERGDANQRNPLYAKILNKEMASADCGVFQFDGAMDPYGCFLPVDVRVIPNPCIKSLETVRDASAVENVIVGAGRLVPDKGFATLIEAFAAVARDRDVKLVIYGDGPDRERLEGLVASFGLECRVSLPGAVRNVAEKAQKARLFVLASQYEGCPNTLIEAMCAGVPIVAADCSPGGACFLTKGGTIGGPIVPVDDAGAMAAAICRMLENPNEAEELGQKGAALADLYPMERVMGMWVDMFNELLGGPAAFDHRVRGN